MYQFTNLSHRSITLGDGSTLGGKKSITKNSLQLNSRVEQLMRTGVLIVKEVTEKIQQHNISGNKILSNQQEEFRQKALKEREERLKINSNLKTSVSNGGRKQKTTNTSEDSLKGK